MSEFGPIKLQSFDPMKSINQKVVEENAKRNAMYDEFSKNKKAKEQQEMDHYQKTNEMAQEISELRAQLDAIAHTLDIMYMAIGAQGQRATREHIEIKKLMEEYFSIMQAQEDRTTKDNKLIAFFKTIPAEVCLKIIIDGGFAIMKSAFM